MRIINAVFDATMIVVMNQTPAVFKQYLGLTIPIVFLLSVFMVSMGVGSETVTLTEACVECAVWLVMSYLFMGAITRKYDKHERLHPIWLSATAASMCGYALGGIIMLTGLVLLGFMVAAFFIFFGVRNTLLFGLEVDVKTAAREAAIFVMSCLVPSQLAIYLLRYGLGL